MFHFSIFVRVVVALRYSRFEGDLTFSPPRMNTVLGVTCFVITNLAGLLGLFSHSCEQNPILFLNLSFVRPMKTIRQILHILTFTRMRTALCSQLEHYFRSPSY